MAERPLLALLDGHSLAFRAFYALPEDMQTTTGQVTNAVYGFTTMLIKLLGDERPQGIGAAFDRGRPPERLALLPEYKAQRVAPPDTFSSQMPLIFDIVDALGIPRLARDETEADDIIATYATRAVADGWDVLVVTGDRDAFQLVDEHVRVLYTRRGITDTVVMDAAAVEEKYGVAPAAYPMLAALRGDSSDNIAGVPGVGDKTAAKLLTQFGDLDGLFAHLDEVKGKKLPTTLAEHADAVRRGHEVIVLDREVPLETSVDALRMGTVDTEKVRQIFGALEFRSLWERLQEALLDAQDEVQTSGFADEPVALGPGDLAAWLSTVAESAPVAVVAGTTGRPPHVAWASVAVAAAGARPAAGRLDDLSDADRRALAVRLADPLRPLVIHDLKELLHAADSRGWVVAGVRTETELAAYLVAPAQRDFGLDRLAVQYLQKQLALDDPGAEAGEQQLALAVDDDDAAAAVERTTEEALSAQAVLELADVLDAELAARDQTTLLHELELPLVPVLRSLEQTGIAVDVTVLDEMSAEMGARVDALRREVFAAAGHEFNLDSPKQLQVVLFDELGLTKTKRMKTGYSTDAGELGRIEGEHALIPPLLAYREVAKLKGTYVDALPQLVDPATGRIHARLNQTVAVTGRLSSDQPNLQNIPIRTTQGREIRRAFVPGEGFSGLLVADYSQVELRVMAHLSQDPGLLAAFRSGEDIHATTAAKVFDIPLAEVDGMQRNRIKFMTYGLAYGLSAFGLGQQLGVPPEEAAELQEAYFTRFPGVRGYLRGVVDQARRDGWTQTMFGRRRYLPDLISDRRQRREMAERMALNAPIQGTAADIIKRAMIAVAGAMEERGLRSQLLLQVHDELVCETAPGEEDELRSLLVSEMAGVAELAVPLEVDTATGPSWAEAEKH